MKNFVTVSSLTILVFFGTFSLSAQVQNFAENSYLADLVEESLLLDVASGLQTIVVGERGHVLVNSSNQFSASDTGFKQVIVPTKTTLTSVYTRGKNAWAVGHDATIIKSTDAGNTWRLIQRFPELDRPLLDVFFFDDNEGIAIGAYGLFYRSSDAGETWQQESHPSVLSKDDSEYLASIKDDKAFYLEELSFISPHFNKVSFHNETLYLAGEAGLVAISKDRGRSWQRLDLDYLGSFFDVGFLPNGEILAVGLRGKMFIYSNNNWLALNSCVTTSLNAIVSTHKNTFILGNNGVVLALDLSKMNNNQFSKANDEACKTSSAITLVDTNFSEAILNGKVINNNLLAISAGGLHIVAVEN